MNVPPDMAPIIHNNKTIGFSNSDYIIIRNNAYICCDLSTFWKTANPGDTAFYKSGKKYVGIDEIKYTKQIMVHAVKPTF